VFKIDQAANPLRYDYHHKKAVAWSVCNYKDKPTHRGLIQSAWALLALWHGSHRKRAVRRSCHKCTTNKQLHALGLSQSSPHYALPASLVAGLPERVKGSKSGFEVR
jgi:hypothetical protein